MADQSSRPATFPYHQITVAFGPDRAERFNAATAHFIHEGENVADRRWKNGEDRAVDIRSRHVARGDKSDDEFALAILRLPLGDICDVAAIEDPSSKHALAAVFILVDTGHAAVCSMDVGSLAEAHAAIQEAVGYPVDERVVIAL